MTPFRLSDFRLLSLLAILLLFGPYIPSLGLLELPIRLDHLVVPLLAFAVLMRAVHSGRLVFPLPLWCYALFFLWLVGVTLVRPAADIGLTTLLAALDSYLRPFLVLLIALNVSLTPRETAAFFRLVLYAAVPLCLIGILQALPGAATCIDRAIYELWTNRSLGNFAAYREVCSGRAMSLFGQFSTFGMFCLFGIALLAGQALGGTLFRSSIFSWLLLPVFAVAGLLTRDPLFAWGSILFLLLLLAGTGIPLQLLRPRRVLLLGAILLLLGLFLRQFFWASILDAWGNLAALLRESANSFLQARLGIADTPGKLFRTGAIETLTTHPIAGLGFGVINQTTDSFLFGLLAMGGLVGLALFLFFVLSVLRMLSLLSRRSSHPLAYAHADALRALTVVYLVATFGFHTFIQDRSGDVYWLAIGLLLGPGWLWTAPRRSATGGSGNSVPVRVAIQQRVIPHYRVPFFDALARSCGGGLELYAGSPLPNEAIIEGTELSTAERKPLRNIHLCHGDHWTLCWQRGLLDELDRSQAGLLVCEANPRLLTTHLAVRLFHARRKPVVGWGLGFLPWDASEWITILRHSALRRFYRQFDALIAYGSQGARDYESLGVPPERIFIARNAVSNEEADRLRAKAEADPSLLPAWKRELGLSDRPVLLFVGRLIPEKRVGDLIQACSRLRHPCELIIVGDGPERESLEDLARRLKPETRFLGALRGAELARAFAVSDLFVLPGRGGLAMQEAMTYALPVLVSAADGTQSDLVRPGENGFLLDAGDLVGLTQRIDACLEDPARSAQMGRASERIIREEHNLDLMVQAYVHALCYALEHGPVATPLNTEEAS